MKIFSEITNKYITLIITVSLTALIAHMVTKYLNSSQALEVIKYDQRLHNAGLSLRSLPNHNITIRDGKDKIDNLSSNYTYLAHLEGKHLEKLRLIFTVGKNENGVIPDILTAELKVPKNYPKSGFRRIDDNYPDEIIFEIDAFNVNDNLDAMYNSFQAQFTFKSRSPAEMIIKPATPGVSAEKYSRETHTFAIAAKIILTVILAIYFIVHLMDKKILKDKEETLKNNQESFTQKLNSTDQLDLAEEEKEEITKISNEIIEKTIFPSRFNS